MHAFQAFQRTLPVLVAIFLLVITAIVLSQQLSTGRYLHYDEFYSLERSHGFIRFHDWFSVYSYNEVTAKKPPLQYWLNAALLSLGVPDLLAIRFWSLCFFLGTMVVAAMLATNLCKGNRWAGPAIMLLLLCSVEFIQLSRSGLLDSGLAFFMVSALYALELTRRHERAWLLLGIVLGLGFLQKAPVGLLYVAIMLVTFHRLGLKQYGWPQLRQSSWFNRGFYSFIVLTLSWPVIQTIKIGSSYFSTAIKQEMLNRFSPVESGKNQAANSFQWLDWLWHDLHFVAILAVAATLCVLVCKRWRSEPFLFALALVSILVAICFTLATGSLYPRYLAALSPLLLIPLVVVTSDLSGRWKPLVFVLAAACTGLSWNTSSAALNHISREDSYSRAQYIVQLVDSHRREGDRVIMDGSTVPPGSYGVFGESTLPFYGYRAYNSSLARFFRRHGVNYGLIGVTDLDNRPLIEAAIEGMEVVTETDDLLIWRYSPSD